MRIGDYVLDLSKVKHLFDGPKMIGSNQDVFASNFLNAFMSLGSAAWKETRQYLKSLLSKDNPILRDNKELRNHALVPIEKCQMHLPAQIGDYTDFYSSKDHATNVGKYQLEQE